MKTVIVASQNPVKLQAVQEGFARMFPGEEFCIQSISVPSGVDAQPRSDRETLQGALNRVENARRAAPEADFWAGVEGGIEDDDPSGSGSMSAFAWVVISDSRRLGKARTGAFFLPQQVAELVRQGKELGEADDLVFQRSNSKQENGAVGILTGDVLDRAGFYVQAVILALIPFKNEALYPVTS